MIPPVLSKNYPIQKGQEELPKMHGGYEHMQERVYSIHRRVQFPPAFIQTLYLSHGS